MDKQLEKIANAYAQSLIQKSTILHLDAVELKNAIYLSIRFLFLQLNKKNVQKHDQFIQLLEQETIKEIKEYTQIVEGMELFTKYMNNQPITGFKVEKVVEHYYLFDTLKLNTPYNQLKINEAIPYQGFSLATGQKVVVHQLNCSGTIGVEGIYSIQTKQKIVYCQLRLLKVHDHFEIFSFGVREVLQS